MFEKTGLHCPRCGFEIRDSLDDGAAFTCALCSGRYRVMADEQTGKVAFYEAPGEEAPEPLHLPKGSIRALVALAMAASCWVLIFTGRDVPGALLGLILTILGYYFGFRAKVAGAASRIYDPAARPTAPLGLPAGAIRWLLILGFLASGVLLYVRGRLGRPEYLEFFVILLGLVVGYLFGRVSARGRGSKLYLLVNHVKGAAVLVVTGALVVLLVTGLYAEAPAHLVIVLCAGVSFYYGSRT